MLIKLRFFALLREIVGLSDLEIKIEESKTIKEILDSLNEIDEKTKIVFFEKIKKPNFKIIINGNSINSKELNKILIKEKSEIVFIPPVGGG